MTSEPAGSDTEPAQKRAYGVKFFPYAADLTDRINAWADEEGVHVLKVVPVYLEGTRDGR